MDSKLKFLSNNVNGVRSSKKRIKMFEYFGTKSLTTELRFYRKRFLPSMYLTNGGIILQMARTDIFSYGTTNSCGVMTGLLGNKKIKCNKIRTDNNGRIIILGAEIDDEIFLLINLHDPNTEALQVKTLCELEQMLDMFSMIFLQKCFVKCFAGDFNCFFTIWLISGEYVILFQNAIPLEKIIFQDTCKGLYICF